MRIFILVFTFVMALTGQSCAQFELSPFAGYTFQHRFDVTGGEAKLGGGFSFGGTIGYRIGPGLEAEVLFSHQNNQSTANSIFLSRDVDEATTVQYFMGGLNKIWVSRDESTNYFLGFKLGSASLSSRDNNFASITQFAVLLNGGVKYFVSERFGLRGGAGLGIPIYESGAGLWWSPGSPTGVNREDWSPIVQFGLQVGVIYKIIL